MRSIDFVMLAVSGLVYVGSAGADPGDRELRPEVVATQAAAPPPTPATVSYDGHRAVRVTVHTPRQLMMVLALTDDVLTCHGAGIGTFDVRFSPEQWAEFAKLDIAHEVLIEDLQAHFDAWLEENDAIRAQDSGWYDAFRDMAEIQERLESLAAAHPELATVSSIGDSIEARPIWMIRITGPGSTQQRPAMVINATQHAREALSPMTAMYFAEALITRYATDPRVKEIVDGIDFYIIPVMNPDGYIYAWTVNSMWRKNRRVNPGTTCIGVDLNRDWGYQWGQAGAGTSPCGETYRGEGPFSEPETQVVAAVIDALSLEGRLRMHLDLHGSLQRLYSPWAYTTQPPPDLALMQHLGAAMQQAIATHRGRIYGYGAGAVLNSYHYAGNAVDYSYGNFGAMSWTVEPAGGTFYPPPNQIIPVGEEMALGFLALAEYFLPAGAPGACCIASGCHSTGAVRCAEMGGEFHGAGTACGPRDCPLRLATAPSASYVGNGGGGLFFDITAHARPITVSQLEFYLSAAAGTPVQVDVHTHPGSYIGRDGDPAGWSLLESADVVSAGPGTAVRLALSSPLVIDSEKTTGVYIIVQTGGIAFITSLLQAAWPGTNVSLFSDLARTAPWSGTPSLRTFAGAVYYTIGDGRCYANCDGSSVEPILNVDDFTCFIDAFAAAQGLPHEEQVMHYANCDESTAAPVLNVDDFLCFIDAFVQGCP